MDSKTKKRSLALKLSGVIIIMIMMLVLIPLSTGRVSADVVTTYDSATNTLTFTGTAEFDFLQIATVSSAEHISEADLNVVIKDIYTVGRATFASKKNIKTVTMSNVKKIYDNAFDGCSNLTTIDFGTALNEIGSSAFQNCTGLKTVTIPASVTKFGPNGDSFLGCTGLETVIYQTTIDVQNTMFSGCTSLKSITFASDTTGIGTGAFSGCSGLKTITLPAQLSEIKNYTFSGCSSLSEITIPSTVKTIGASAFDGCTSLSSISLPEGITKIGLRAFGGCTGLKSVTIPASVKSIQWGAFYGCSNISRFEFKGTVCADGSTVCGSGIEDGGLNGVGAYYKRALLFLPDSWTDTLDISSAYKGGYFKYYVPVTGVTLNKTSEEVYIGYTVTLTATVSPEDASTNTVIWSSGDTSVATVSSSGVVTGVSAGSAVITVTTDEGGKTATCTVTVKKIPLYEINVTENIPMFYSQSGTAYKAVNSDGTDASSSALTDNADYSVVYMAALDIDGVISGVAVVRPDSNYIFDDSLSVSDSDCVLYGEKALSGDTLASANTLLGGAFTALEGDALFTWKLFDYSNKPTPLTFTAEELGSTISLSWDTAENVKYSLDGGATWNSYSEGEEIGFESIGDTVSFSAKGISTGYSSHFSMSGKISASGDVTSLTNGIGGDAALSSECYKYMFYNCDSLTTVPSLPSTTLADGCYKGMFEDCETIEAGPELPATNLAEYCYAYMFSYCSNLSTAPDLSAETLAEGCYEEMFYSCEGLITAPALPAETLTPYCYEEMFAYCSNLINPPALPATIMAEGCYYEMFAGCDSLTTVPVLKPTALAEYCYSSMFYSCDMLKVVETDDASEACWIFPSSDEGADWWNDDMIEGLLASGTLTSVEKGKMYKIVPATPVCKIGDKEYIAITAALKADYENESENNPTVITLIDDVFENVNFYSGRYITVDLNNHVWSANVNNENDYSVIINTAYLTVKDSSSTKTTRYFIDNECEHGVIAGSACSGCEGSKALRDGCFETMVSAAPNGEEGVDYIKVQGGVITRGPGYDGQYGGAVANLGTLKLVGVNIVGNHAQFGGAIFGQDSESISITDCTIAGNSASENGGAIVIFTDDPTLYSLTIDGTTTIAHNTVLGIENNISLFAGQKIKLGDTIKNGSVGITMETPGQFTSNGKKNDASSFFSDDEAYEVAFSSNHLELTEKSEERQPSRIPFGGLSSLVVSVEGDKSSVKVKTSLFGTYAVISNITDKEIKKVGTGSYVTINLTGLGDKITGLVIPKTSIENVAKSNALGLKVKMPDGTVAVFDKTALSAVASQAKGSYVQLVIERGTKAQGSMNSKQRAAVSTLNSPVILNAYFVSDGTRISDFKGGEATITLPYQTTETVTVWYVTAEGTLEEVPSTSDEKTVSFTTGHFSIYAIEGEEVEQVVEETEKTFVDIAETDYYYDAVLWAASNGITSGTDDTHFSPLNITTRAQMVTFLWRAAGSPVVNHIIPFTDVSEDAYYCEAVRWGVSEGIIKGTSDTTFSPDATVTRAQAVTFLYRYNAFDTMEIKDNPFTDIKEGAYYYDAVLWAVKNGITDGISSTAFAPDNGCQRGQIVTFLYRYFVNQE